MQFITALLGGSDNPMLNAAFALGIVLVLIVLGVWALKLFTNAGESLGRGRGRIKRISVVDSAVVDGKRRVVIIRRDNVEHVIMTGGPADLVIESGVPVAEPPPRRSRPHPHAQTHRPQPRPREPEAAAPPPPPAHAPVQHNVPREAIDRLRDLTRPAPLKPRDSLRQSHLLRPVPRPDIPTGPQLRVDNSASRPADSATAGPVTGSDGSPRSVARRFFRNTPHREPR